MGRVAAWRMAIRRPKEYRSKVDAATRCRGAWSHGLTDCVRWWSFCWGGDGPCGGLEDGHQDTEGVPLEGRCGNALLRRMLPLTD